MNKKTEAKKKLELKRETVRVLTGNELHNVAGGGSLSQSNILYNCGFHPGPNPK